MGSKHFYFANDCIHFDSLYFSLRQIFGEFTGVFAGYAVANGYSWGVDFSECEDFETRISTAEGARLRQLVGWDHVGRVARILKAKWVVPYASSYRFLSRDLFAKNSYFGTDEQIYDVNLGEAIPIVLKHGESVSALNPGPGQRRPATRPEVPESLKRPNLFNQNFDDSTLDSLVNVASGFFLEVYQRASKKWRLAMAIELVLLGQASRRSCFFSFSSAELRAIAAPLEDADVSIEFPASVVEDIVAGRVLLADAYVFFCVNAKWRRYKHGQTGFTSWV